MVGDTIKGVQSFGAAVRWIFPGERGGAEKASINTIVVILKNN